MKFTSSAALLHPHTWRALGGGRHDEADAGLGPKLANRQFTYGRRDAGARWNDFEVALAAPGTVQFRYT
jgi:hypothetical protein